MTELARPTLLPQRIAIQGELGSNSHMAALAMLPGQLLEIVPCPTSAEVFSAVIQGLADAAVLPIENSLHGSVAEHYDLLLAQPVRILAERLLRIRHNIIAHPAARLGDLRRILSHPVALSQCRRWLAAHPELEAVHFYDTAGSVKYLMAANLRDTGGVAPALAAEQYGASILVEGIEDHEENYTRFYFFSSVKTACRRTFPQAKRRLRFPSCISPAPWCVPLRSSPAPASTSRRSSPARSPAPRGSTSSSSTCALSPKSRSTQRRRRPNAIATCSKNWAATLPRNLICSARGELCLDSADEGGSGGIPPGEGPASVQGSGDQCTSFAREAPGGSGLRPSADLLHRM